MRRQLFDEKEQKNKQTSLAYSTFVIVTIVYICREIYIDR